MLQLVNWQFSESYGLYHMTAAPHAESEKNGGTSSSKM